MILKILPRITEYSWGKKELDEQFSRFRPLTHDRLVSEIILVSGKPEHNNKIKNLNMTLKQFYGENREKLFNNYKSYSFPIVIKIQFIEKDFGVKVYPSGAQARKYLNYPYGKSAFWYIIDSKKDQEVYLGHNAKKQKELKLWLENREFDNLFKKVKIEKEKTYNIGPGTIHGLTKGITLLKITNGADIVVNLTKHASNQNYLEDKHLYKINKTIKYNNDIYQKPITIIKNDVLNVTILNKNDYLTLEKWEIEGRAKLRFDKFIKNFLVITCLSGRGYIGQTMISKWESIVVTTDELKNFYIDGKMSLLITHPN